MPSFWLISLVALVLTLPGLSSAQGKVEVRDGEKGYIHLIIRGDTLWDISNHYLGTPWVWPSVWTENEYIANPHLIYPQDAVWISERLMRKLTPEEAERLRQAMAEAGEDFSASSALEILGSEDGSEDMAAADSEARDGSEAGDGSEYSDGSEYAGGIPGDEGLLPYPADLGEELEEAPSLDDPFAALDQGETGVSRVMRFSGLHRYGFVSDLQYTGTAAIMGSHEAHYWSSQGQAHDREPGRGQGPQGRCADHLSHHQEGPPPGDAREPWLLRPGPWPRRGHRDPPRVVLRPHHHVLFGDRAR